MENYSGKKLLILGGASFHVKLVKAAQELGAYTIVTDNLTVDRSPAKQISDEHWEIDIYDIAGLVKKCREESVEGVISGWLDPCQRPYAELCKALELPCYGTPEQFIKMTDKIAFKRMCAEYGVDTIPEYTIEEAEQGKVVYPVFVKPNDSRGSRGQAVCYNKDELLKAIEDAKEESSNGKVIIEKYITGSQEFHVTYFFVDGEPHLLRASDNYCGAEEMNMQKVVSCAVIPSRYTAAYMNDAHFKVVNMFKALGIQYGPIFMQGFVDHGVFRFFDPGLRFPGVDFELVFKKVNGVDLMKAMVKIAFTGKCDISIPSDAVYLNGKRASVLYLTVSAGHIAKISGEDEAKRHKDVVSYLPRCKEGDTIAWSYNVNQRLAEIDLLASNTEELLKDIRYINSTVTATDDAGNDLVFARFDTSRVVE